MKRIGSRDVEPAPGEPEKFTGTVFREDVLEPTDGGMSVTRFSYAPKAWSRWHAHEGEQVLQIVSGSTIVVKEDGGVVHAVAGDLIHLAPGERHWHGSLPSEFLVMTAFTASEGTDWLGEVDSDAYRRAAEQPRE